MESLYEINQRVWDTGATEVHEFDKDYFLIQSEHPSGSHGNTYLFSRYQEKPLLYINWQSSGISVYLNPFRILEAAQEFYALTAVDARKTAYLLDCCYLTIDTGSEDDEWMQFRYYPEFH